MFLQAHAKYFNLQSMSLMPHACRCLQLHRSELLKACLYTHESPAAVIYPQDEWVMVEMMRRMHITPDTPRNEVTAWESEWGTQSSIFRRQLQIARGQNNSELRHELLGLMMPGDPRAEGYGKQPLTQTSCTSGDPLKLVHFHARVMDYLRNHRGNG